MGGEGAAFHLLPERVAFNALAGQMIFCLNQVHGQNSFVQYEKIAAPELRRRQVRKLVDILYGLSS